jgi:hypothetical protein
MKTEIGICDDCNSFTGIELFDDEELVGKEIAKLENPIRRSCHWILRTLESIIGDRKSDNLDKKCSGLYRRLDLIRERKGDERCLACGGRNVVPFTGKYKYSVRGCDHESRTGFIHSKCGGEIIYKDDRSRLAFPYQVRSHSPNGEYLMTEYPNHPHLNKIPSPALVTR